MVCHPGAETVMERWDAWTPERFFYLFIGLAYMMVWVQVLLMHWRGAFRFRIMWAPVLEAPVLSLMGVVFAFVHGGWLNTLFIIVFTLGALGGLAGTYFHFKGIRRYIGGWTIRNFLAGPPPMLPLTFSALSIGALLVYFAWHTGG